MRISRALVGPDQMNGHPQLHDFSADRPPGRPARGLLAQLGSASVRTMASQNVFTIEAAQLAGLQEVAAGAQGRIFAAPTVRLDDRWPALYKEFHPHVLDSLNAAALEQIVGLP